MGPTSKDDLSPEDRAKIEADNQVGVGPRPKGRGHLKVAVICGLAFFGMTTATDKNVACVSIQGSFDDCQAIVKQAFQDDQFRHAVDLSGVNSINWARIAAQSVYFFTAAVALGAPARKVAFVVPTGNFGDAYAAYVATRMPRP